MKALDSELIEVIARSGLAGERPVRAMIADEVQPQAQGEQMDAKLVVREDRAVIVLPLPEGFSALPIVLQHQEFERLLGAQIEALKAQLAEHTLFGAAPERPARTVVAA